MTLTRIGVFSAAKIGGLLYAVMGLLIGALFSLISVLGVALGGTGGTPEQQLFGLFFGIGAVVILPVLYGVMGFVFLALTAFLYNVLSTFTGGLELELK